MAFKYSEISNCLVNLVFNYLALQGNYLCYHSYMMPNQTLSICLTVRPNNKISPEIINIQIIVFRILFLILH